MPSEFLRSYTERRNASDRLVFVREQYEELQQCQIGITEKVRHLLGELIKGECVRSADGYEITVFGDARTDGYLTYHEALHVWLEERGFSLQAGQQVEEIQDFFLAAKNMVNDFLIEKEVERQCGSYYGDLMASHKNKDILASLAGIGSDSGVQVFCEGILVVALSKLYPGMRDLAAVEIFSEIIHHPGRDKIVSLLQNVDLDTLTPEQYRQLVSDILHLLTCIRSLTDGNKVYFPEPELLDWIDSTEEEIATIRRAFSNYGRTVRRD